MPLLTCAQSHVYQIDVCAIDCSDTSERQSDVFSERKCGYPTFGPGNTFAFKLKVNSHNGKVGHYRFNCGKFRNLFLSQV